MIVIQDGPRWLRFEEPVRVVCVREPDSVPAALEEVETAVSTQNLHAAGFLTYEAAAAFGLAAHGRRADELPLLWFGLFPEPEVWESLPPSTGAYALGDWAAALTPAAYERGFVAIKEQIAAGRTYQVNYTFPLRTTFSGDAWALFQDVAAQQNGYAAYLDTGRRVICSASPELFFRLEGDALTSMPMKGTAVRGRTLDEDEANIAWLRHSEKNRAENVMIVDMIRSDVGQVAETGSVQVPSLFDVARYPTVLQMTSTVTAKTEATVAEIMRAMFPCSSITGAPKVRTMQIIRDLEPEPRGVYTGAIGFIAPGRRAQFSVAIRTVTIDRERGTAVYNVGSGVVWDSEAGAEYDECLLKGEAVARKRPSFDLLESLRWTPEEGYFLLRRHVARLLRSAVYFEAAVGETAVLDALHAFAQTLTEASKVRLLLAQTGRLRVEAGPLAAGAVREPVRLGLAAEPVHTDNVFLYHKTTQREVYAQAKASRPDCDEVVLWNERGEVTEATSANLVADVDGALVTPPVSSGLLAGTYREALLANGRIRERILTPANLERSEAIYLINSVRGWRTAVYVAG
jgi:para-aminobenzoate synthetase/4-amino-4-deoxychorismate lyase